MKPASYRMIQENHGRVNSMIAAAASFYGYQRTALLQQAARLVKPSPTPHHTTGIAKARRLASKNRNILHNKRSHKS